MRPVGVLTTGFGAPGGSTEGGKEEFEELRFSCDRNSRSSACKAVISFRASSKSARRRPHSGQEATGVAEDSLIQADNTEVARNCKVLRDYRRPFKQTWCRIRD